MKISCYWIVAVSISATVAIERAFIPCKPAPKWALQGRDVMQEVAGNVAMIALMELRCPFCIQQLEGYPK